MSATHEATSRRNRLFIVIVLACSAVAPCSGDYPTQPPTSGTIHGRGCNPPFGYRPNACGDQTVLSRVFEPICQYLWGPNVCLVTDTVQANVVQYQYSRGCDWVFSHYYYQWIRQCSYVCQPTKVCLDETQVFNRSYESCCPGFVARRPENIQYNRYNRFHYSYYTPLTVRAEGCPRAVADSLLECLVIHGLTEFTSYVNDSVYFSILNETTSSHITLFALTNDAVIRGRMMDLIPPVNEPLFNNSEIVANHLVPGNVTMASLRQHGSKIYVNLNGRNLHRTSVSFTDNSYFTRPENPYYNNHNTGTSSSQYRVVPFINGAQVVIEDACETENGTLHIIDTPLTPSDGTIAQFFRNNPARFSMFTAALDSANLLSFLDNPNVSRTVFAVENDVFSDTFPPALLNCLSDYLLTPFKNIMRLHIGRGAYYSSTLSIVDFFYTLQNQFLRVRVDPDTNNILLGPCESVVIEADMVLASNGVVHVIDRVLFPDNFNFDMCTQFVPDPSPAECPVEPSPSPSPSPSPTIDMDMETMTALPIPFGTPTSDSQFVFG